MHARIERVYGPFSAIRSVHSLYLAKVLRTRRCLHRVDKIYGALGRMTDLCLKIDYSKDPAEVYRDFSVAVVDVLSNCEILDYVYHTLNQGTSPDPTLPSWVPDWSQIPDVDNPCSPFSTDFSAGKSSHVEAAEVTARVEGTSSAVLSTRGTQLGTVTVVANPVRRHERDFDEQEAWFFVESGTRPAKRAVDIELCLATTLCGGIDCDKQPVTASVVKTYLAWRSLATQSLTTTLMSELTGQDSQDEDRRVDIGKLFRRDTIIACCSQFPMSALDLVLPLCGAEMLLLCYTVYGYKWPVLLRPAGEQYTFWALRIIAKRWQNTSFAPCKIKSLDLLKILRIDE